MSYLPAHLFRQFHQPDEHGRHHEDGVDFLILNDAQKLFRIEPRHQHQRAAEPARAQPERIRRRVIQRPRQQRADAGPRAVDHRAHALARGGLLRRRRVPPHALGMAGGAGGIDHVHRRRQRRAVVRLLLKQPVLQIGRAFGRGEMIRIDLVVRQDFRRRRRAEHGDAGRNCIAELMQHVGVADQHARAGIFQHIGDLFRLEMPVDRHRIGAEQRHRIGRLDEGDVVAHQDADAVALADAELLQAAGDAAGAVGDLGVGAASIAGDDAEEERLGGGHCVLLVAASSIASVISRAMSGTARLPTPRLRRGSLHPG